MADSRVKDFTNTLVVTSLADIQGVFLWADKEGWTDAEKFELSSILLTGVIADVDAKDYELMTAAAFKATVMNGTRYGVNRLAIGADVTAKTGQTVIACSSQGVMQAQWKKDWFEGIVPNVYKANNLALPAAIQFEGFVNQEIAAGNRVKISPDLPAGYRFEILSYQVASYSDFTGVKAGLFDTIAFNGFVVRNSILGALSSLELSADGRDVSIYAPSSTHNNQTSISLNGIIVPV